jgi:hypothetical protein
MTADIGAPALPTVADSGTAAAAAPEVRVGTHSVPERYLYAYAMRGEVIQHVRTQAGPADRSRLPAILADWDTLQSAVRTQQAAEAGLPDNIEIKELPTAAGAFTAITLADPLVAKAFGSWSHDIAMAEIGKLVFPQRAINEWYVGQLKSQYPSRPDLEDLLRICVSPRTGMAPIQHLEVAPNTHVFTSPNTDLRFLGAFLKDEIELPDTSLVEAGGLPAAAVLGFVGYGTPVINAFRVGQRLILNNGHHRVCALQELGVTKIPILILEAPNPAAQVPAIIGGTPRELCLVPRPPLAKDLLEERLSITLQVKERIKQLTAIINVSQYDIPA